MFGISLFPISGQIMSGLVEEMLQTQGAENNVICDILLILAGDYMDKLMDVMMVHYQPNNSLNTVIVTSLANIARAQPGMITPFVKPLLVNTAQMIKNAKLTEMSLRLSLTNAITQFFEVGDWSKMSSQ